jgi:hypothetical protein
MMENIVVNVYPVGIAPFQKSRWSFLTQIVERKGRWRARGDSNSRPYV